MQTSYFHHPECDFSDPRLVSIARWAPNGYRGRRYSALAPKKWMMSLEDEAECRAAYKEEIIDALDPRKVFEDLGKDAILLCWEPPGKFCHRRLVATWLEEQLGVQVPELPQNDNPKQKDLFT